MYLSADIKLLPIKPNITGPLRNRTLWATFWLCFVLIDCYRLTVRQRDGDDDPVPSTDPQTVARHRERRDPDEWEAKFPRTWRQGATEQISPPLFSTAPVRASGLRRARVLETDRASCWRRARCRRPAGAAWCGRGTASGWSLAWWTPRCRHPPRPADGPGCPYGGGRQTTSAKRRRKMFSCREVTERKETPECKCGGGFFQSETLLVERA